MFLDLKNIQDQETALAIFMNSHSHPSLPSREMITRFNQVVGMIVVEDYGYDAQGNVRYKPRWKIKAEKQ